MKVKIISLTHNGSVYNLLENVPYQWRATEIFGGELLRGNYDENIYSFYIRKKDLNRWLGYIKDNGDVNAIPNVRLFVVDKLPEQYEENDKVVNLETLIEDLRHSWAIRYWENHADHIKRIYMKHKKLAAVKS